MNRKRFVVVVVIAVLVVMIGLAVYVQLELRRKDAVRWTGKIHTNIIGMEFVHVPPTGNEGFMMGSPESEDGRKSNEKQHKVILTKGFYLQTTEVTQGQWKEIMGTEPWKGESFVREGPDHPAVWVSWHEAQKFIKKLNKKEGTNKYRLPTEAEWEYACRAGTTTAYYWGNKMDGKYCWYNGNSNRRIHPVGTREPNAWGLYDMSGNVEEWCQDWHDWDYFNNSPEKDPQGPPNGRYPVQRGGSWLNPSSFCRSANRSWNYPDPTPNKYGFRIARDPD